MTGPLLAGLVWLITAGIAVQAVLAGQFVSGLRDLRGAHAGVANALDVASWLLILVALLAREAPGAYRLGALLLGVAVHVQAILGYAPGAVPTALHVPFGVLLFAGAASLSATVRPRRGRDSPRAAARTAAGRRAAP